MDYAILEWKSQQVFKCNRSQQRNKIFWIYFRLSGRDMITFGGVGNGKSWIPVIPLAGLCLQEEKSMPIIRGEGPFAIIMAPSVIFNDFRLF
jgi:hypothetical protein